MHRSDAPEGLLKATLEQKAGLHQQRRKDVAVQHVVPAHCAVPCDVTQGPHSLQSINALL